MNKPLQTLIVEDSEDDALLIVRALNQGGYDCHLTRVQTAAGLQSALESKSWDIVISDHSMPAFSSRAALEILQNQELDIPFILVSGAIGEEQAVEIMKAGASDYVSKAHLDRLAPTLDRVLREALHRRARRRAEDALCRSQQELSDCFEQAAVGLHWAGPDGTILRANRAELNMLGYTREEYLGHKFSEFCLDDDAAEEMLARLHRGEPVDNYEARLQCRDGSIRNVVMNSNVLWEKGKFIHSRCFTRDITEQKRGDEARAYLAAIVDSSENAIIGANLAGVILSWNGGAERMYRYSAEEMKGRSLAVLVSPNRPEELSAAFDRIRQGGRVERYETVRVRRDGTTLDTSVALSPIRNARGKVVGVSAIEADITERKRVEEERLGLINELTEALGKIRTLRGLLPICSACKKIRDDQGYWQKVESYISAHTEAEFTHGICPDCITRLYPEYAPAKTGTLKGKALSDAAQNQK
ncbi:MAG TPA: PAS domain S-box protein [Verrucomicrobiae bacterium]|nr:PAS domain S-box protein [Verrucomicrobiae bacterium]